MADDVTLPATGAQVATDEVDFGGGAAHAQIVKLASGEDGSSARIPGSAARGLAVEPRLKIERIAATPTISTTAYASGDAVGGLLTFSNAARSSGGSIRLESIQVVDKAQQYAELVLVLFDRSITPPTDNAAFDPTDAELSNVIGVVPIGGGFYSGFSDNGVASVTGLGLAAKLNGTDLFGVLVAASAPTYASTSDLVVTATVAQD